MDDDGGFGGFMDDDFDEESTVDTPGGLEAEAEEEPVVIEFAEFETIDIVPIAAPRSAGSGRTRKAAKRPARAAKKAAPARKAAARTTGKKKAARKAVRKSQPVKRAKSVKRAGKAKSARKAVRRTVKKKTAAEGRSQDGRQVRTQDGEEGRPQDQPRPSPLSTRGSHTNRPDTSLCSACCHVHENLEDSRFSEISSDLLKLACHFDRLSMSGTGSLALTR